MTTAPAAPPSIHWYRSPLPKEVHQRLHERSDLMGFLQTGGYLGLLACTGAAAMWSATRLPWYVTVAIVFAHGTGYAFMINGFHELVHDSVFKTRWLNRFFLRIVSFLGWLNHHHFWASHTEHHRFTLHPPGDLEVTLPTHVSRRDFLRSAVLNVDGVKWMVKNTVRLARGRLDGAWELALFRERYPERLGPVIRWARLVLAGHALIVVVSILKGWWMLPVVTTLAPFYASWLFFLLNNTQHIGLVDNVPDFRLCCRTILVNPLFQFLYWHMNYHTEHHMYAAVPCYNLEKLHRAIEADMPACPRGIIATWRQIAAIQERQKTEPDYQYRAILPPAPSGQ